MRIALFPAVQEEEDMPAYRDAFKSAMVLFVTLLVLFGVAFVCLVHHLPKIYVEEYCHFYSEIEDDKVIHSVTNTGPRDVFQLKCKVEVGGYSREIDFLEGGKILHKDEGEIIVKLPLAGATASDTHVSGSPDSMGGEFQVDLYRIDRQVKLVRLDSLWW
jgi:hypothetical protein